VDRLRRDNGWRMPAAVSRPSWDRIWLLRRDGPVSARSVQGEIATAARGSANLLSRILCSAARASPPPAESRPRAEELRSRHVKIIRTASCEEFEIGDKKLENPTRAQIVGRDIVSRPYQLRMASIYDFGAPRSQNKRRERIPTRYFGNIARSRNIHGRHALYRASREGEFAAMDPTLTNLIGRRPKPIKELLAEKIPA
jgi:hypothetical protein